MLERAGFARRQLRHDVVGVYVAKQGRVEWSASAAERRLRARVGEGRRSDHRLAVCVGGPELARELGVVRIRQHRRHQRGHRAAKAVPREVERLYGLDRGLLVPLYSVVREYRPTLKGSLQQLVDRETGGTHVAVEPGVHRVGLVTGL